MWMKSVFYNKGYGSVEVAKPYVYVDGMIGVWPLVNTINVKGNPKIKYQNNELQNKLQGKSSSLNLFCKRKS